VNKIKNKFNLIKFEKKRGIMNTFEFLKLDSSKTKVHLAVENKSIDIDADPMEAYFEGSFKEWQERQSRKNFGREYILSLIKRSLADEWLFAGVFRVKDVKEGLESKYLYETQLCENGENFIGRLLVGHQRNGRNSYLNGENIEHNCRISAILSNKLVCAEFESFKQVLLKRYELEQIIKYEYSTWKTALSSVSGVYLMSDKLTGKLYVGSAYGENGIWGRWETYSKSYHGGNIQLKELFKEKGKEYFQNFQYSILETCDINLSKEQVFSIETRWKNLLLTKEFGYNSN